MTRKEAEKVFMKMRLDQAFFNLEIMKIRLEEIEIMLITTQQALEGVTDEPGSGNMHGCRCDHSPDHSD
jgi:hypothetical protein